MGRDLNNTQPRTHKTISLYITFALTFLYGVIFGIGLLAIWFNSRFPQPWQVAMTMLRPESNWLYFNFADESVRGLYLLRTGGFILVMLALLLVTAWLGAKGVRDESRA